MREFNKQYKLPVKVSHSMMFDSRGFHVLDVVDNGIDENTLEAMINGHKLKPFIMYPVKYEPTKIIDGDGMTIINIRGWGRLQKLKNGDTIQDAIGTEIAALLNQANHA